MSYKDPTPKNIGSTKLSEISMDTATDLVSSPVHDSALRVVEQLFKVTSDILRRQNYFLRSVGNVFWEVGGNIKLSLGVDIMLDILQTDHASSRTISLKITGGNSDTPTSFNTISLADGDLIYLELDSANLTSLVGNTIIIENDVGGGSDVFGKTLRRVNTLSSGMPKLVSPVDGTTSTTFYIPIAYRSGADIHWVPHGITWPASTNSPLGAIITSGITPIPEKFVSSQAALLSSISDLNDLGGGVILLTDSFTLTQKITVGPNIKIIGRGKKTVVTLDGDINHPTLTDNIGYFEMLENSELQDFSIVTTSLFNGKAIHVNGGKRARIRNVVVDVRNSLDTTTLNSYNYNAFDSGKLTQTSGKMVTCSLLQPDGKLLIGGSFTNYNNLGAEISYLIRLNADGTLDTNFCNAAVKKSIGVCKFNGTVRSLALDSDGNIYVGGDFTSYNGTTGMDHLVKLGNNGPLSSGFSYNASYNSKFNGTIYSLALDSSSNNIYVGGDFTDYGGTTGRNRLIKLTSSGISPGDLDINFCNNAVDGSKFSSAVRSLAIDLNGDIYVGGDFINYNTTANRNYLIKLDSAGNLNVSFCNTAVDGSKFSSSPYSLAVDSSNNIYVGGGFINYNTIAGRNRLVKLDSSGNLDTTFCLAAVDGSKFNNFILSLSIDSNDNIYVGGAFTNYNAHVSRDRLVKFDSSGGIYLSFCYNAVDRFAPGPGVGQFNDIIYTLALSNYSIFVGGAFTNYHGGTGRSQEVKLNPDGTVDPTTVALTVTGVKVEANNCRINECWFLGVSSATYRTAIDYTSGSDNADVDSLFE